jgi:hypothetical protein
MASPAPTVSPIARLTALFPKAPNGSPKFITEPGEFNETMERLASSGLCNLLCSIQYVDYIPPVQAVSLRVIVAREDMYYRPKGWGDGGFALKGESLAALFREAGGSYRPSERMDDGKDRLYCHVKATVVMRSMNGLDAPFSKDRELDLRPGSPETLKMTENQLAQAKQTILRVCETKAQLRAIRTALGAKQVYTGAEAALPFVIPTLVPNPDMSNPQHANFMLAHSMGAVEQIYGKGPKALPPGQAETPAGVVDLGTGEVVDVEPVGAHAANAAAGGEDLSGFEPLPEAAKCACPCGCRHEVSEAVAKLTTERGGSVRCHECWPGKAFVYEPHRSLQTLGLNPDISPKKAAELAGGAR